MIQDFKYILLLGACFIVLFAIGELLYHRAKWKGEHSRKFVHIGTGLLTMLFPIWLSSVWSVVLLCAGFLLILQLSLRFNFLKSINDIDRKSYGSVLYPIVVMCVFYLYTLVRNEADDCTDDARVEYFYLPILIMAICDPMAALLGKRWAYGKIKLGNETKTLMGAFGFVCTAIILCIAFLKPTYDSHLFVYTMVISVGACIVELFSKKGIDNFTIPFTVFGLLYCCEHYLHF
jgi:phytol kinase